MGQACSWMFFVKTELQRVFRKLNEHKILLSLNENEISLFWDDSAILEGQVQLQAFDGMESRRMERYESLE